MRNKNNQKKVRKSMEQINVKKIFETLAYIYSQRNENIKVSVKEIKEVKKSA